MAWIHEPTAGVIYSLHSDACSKAFMEAAVEAERGLAWPCIVLMASGLFDGVLRCQHGVRMCVDIRIFQLPRPVRCPHRELSWFPLWIYISTKLSTLVCALRRGAYHLSNLIQGESAAIDDSK